MSEIENAAGAALTTTDLAFARVVVTGASGFLGLHVQRYLRAANATLVRVVDRARAGSRDHLQAPCQTFLFDKPDELVTAVRAAQPDYVIHLHAAITTSRSLAAVRSTLETNLLPSVHLMEACGDMQVKRLILMGSGEEFGPVTGPFDDYTIADPPSPYGASKAAVTGYAKMFFKAFHLPVVVLRPSVVYGPFQAPRMLVPQVMHALLEEREIPVTEGKQKRDFIYVEDVAHGIVRALVAEGVDGHSYNLASGEVVSVRECLKRIGLVTGRENLIRYGAIPYKEGEIFSYEPVATNTYAALRWRPRVSLDEGLAETWKALRDFAHNSLVER